MKLADRSSGELISKKEMEQAVLAIAVWFRLSFQAWLSSEIPNLVAIRNPHAFEIAADAGFGTAVKRAFFETSPKSRIPVPEWVAEIFVEEYNYGPR